MAEQMDQSTLLNIKANQNLILDLYSSKYAVSLQPMIECLRLSPLATTLTMAKNVPLVHLSKAFLIATYQEGEAVITFEIDTQKTSISKSRFSRLLGFSQGRDLVDPDSIFSSAILDMFYQMGYVGNLTILSKFKKPNLPPLWNGLFTLIFKSFSERVTGSDSASKLFFTILYSLYHNSSSPLWLCPLGSIGP